VILDGTTSRLAFSFCLKNGEAVEDVVAGSLSGLDPGANATARSPPLLYGTAGHMLSPALRRSFYAYGFGSDAHVGLLDIAAAVQR
jgi:hypothetical protein